MLTPNQNAQAPRGRLSFLEDFKAKNPLLREAKTPHRCQQLWDLLTQAHRSSGECCQENTLQESIQHCFLDHLEEWQETTTKLPVLVAHSYCSHILESHQHKQEKSALMNRGLSYLVSSGSSYDPQTYLIVIARADVIQAVRMPHDDVKPSPNLENPAPGIHWKKIEQARLANESAAHKRSVDAASLLEWTQDFQAALEKRCEIACSDRSGGFHNSARDQLALAKTILDSNPNLSKYFLKFDNDRDLEDVCGPRQPILHGAAMEQKIKEVTLPQGWGRFHALPEGYSRARIVVPGRAGEVEIQQGGPMRLWKAQVKLNDRPGLQSLDHRHPDKDNSPANYCLSSPQAAVRAAIEMWANYEDAVQGKPTKEDFEKLAADWEQNRPKGTDVHQMVNHPAYRAIIAMGRPAVPWILDRLAKKPDHWFAALNTITGANPVRPEQEGKLETMTKAWLQWAKQQKS